MNFLKRFSGVFFNPKETFQAISQKPVWVDALIIILIVYAIYSYLVAPLVQKDSLQMMENNVKLRERLGEERFNQAIARLKNASPTSMTIRSVIYSPITLLIGFLFSSLIILGFGRFTSLQGKYTQVFAAYLHANFIDKILGNAIRLILVLTRKSVMQTSTGFALFFPKLEVTSPAYILLSQLDFFQLWLFGIFGYAISCIFKIEVRKAMLVSYGFWLLKSILYIALALVTARWIG